MLGSGAAINFQKIPILAKKIISSDEAHIDLEIVAFGFWQGEDVTVNGDRYRAYVELQRRILATFFFNGMAPRATQAIRYFAPCF